MAKAISYVQEGDSLDFFNDTGSAIEYLDIILLNGRVFIAGESIAVNSTGTINAEGVYDLPAKAEALTFGEAVYFDQVNQYITKTASGNTFAGYITENKAAPLTTASVKICDCHVNKAAVIENSTASTVAELVTDFNALLVSLKNAGILAV